MEDSTEQSRDEILEALTTLLGKLGSVLETHHSALVRRNYAIKLHKVLLGLRLWRDETYSEHRLRAGSEAIPRVSTRDLIRSMIQQARDYVVNIEQAFTLPTVTQELVQHPEPVSVSGHDHNDDGPDSLASDFNTEQASALSTTTQEVAQHPEPVSFSGDDHSYDGPDSLASDYLVDTERTSTLLTGTHEVARHPTPISGSNDENNDDGPDSSASNYVVDTEQASTLPTVTYEAAQHLEPASAGDDNDHDDDPDSLASDIDGLERSFSCLRDLLSTILDDDLPPIRGPEHSTDLQASVFLQGVQRETILPPYTLIPHSLRTRQDAGRDTGDDNLDDPMSNAMPRYQYDRLASRRSIRLMHLNPALSSHEPLSCHFVQLNLANLKDERIAYEALSWVWGTLRKDTTLTVSKNGQDQLLQIDDDLHAALVALRYCDQRRYLWIDRICINQEDLAERNAQAAQMVHIYNEAENVCIWLGPATESSTKALAFIPSLLNTYNFENLVSREHLDSWLALVQLMEQPWFARPSATQEISLAKKAEVYHGSASVAWEDLAAAISLMNITDHALNQLVRYEGDFSYADGIFDRVGSMEATILVKTLSRLSHHYGAWEGLISMTTSFTTEDP